MALASGVNKNAIQNQPGYLYLLASPTTVVGTTTLAIIKELMAKFCADGDIRGPLANGIVPYATVIKDGYKDKIAAKPIKCEPNAGSDFIIGYESIDYSAEFTIEETDVDHLKDIMSASGAQVTTVTASSTQAGRSTLLGGGQRYPSDYMLLYRFPSKQCPGEYRHILVPCCNIDLSGLDREHNRQKNAALKISIIAKDFELLPDPVTGLPTKWLEDYVVNPKTA